MTETLVSRCPRRRSTGIGGVWAGVALMALGSWTPANAESSFGHIQTVVGQANLMTGGSQAAIEATANYPIQVGDRVLVSTGGRMEIVLPDGGLLRFDGNSELKFARLAQSLDSGDDRNFFQLVQGQIQISVASEPIDPTAFRIDTANSSLFLLSTGSYRIFTDGKSWTQVIVREGFVEITTERGTHRVSGGQQGLIDGSRSPQVTVQAAPPLDELEQWANRLDTDARSVEAQVPYRRGIVSPTLSYSAAPLHRYGSWMRYREHHVWRPHVSTGWRPYHSGWWVYTPAGLTWVSTEPWGWVPYHYGYWGFAGGIGWVWYPGERYTPGAVYWYWGPTHVGWIPTGYYSGFWNDPFYSLPPFGHFGGHVGRPGGHPGRPPYAPPWGLHSRAGGNVSDWNDWTFSSYDQFGYRNSHRSLKTGAELRNRGVFQDQIPAGVMTTETRNLTPNLWREPSRVLAALETPPSRRSRAPALSPLGEAALSGSSSIPWLSDSRRHPPSSRPESLVRQWDPDLWRRGQLSRPPATAPYRRDSRGSSSALRSPPSSPLTPSQWRSESTSGLSSRYNRGGSSPSRGTMPGADRIPRGGSRLSAPAPRSGLDRGSSATGRPSSTGPPGRVSGSARPGRPAGGSASRSTSTGGGSG